MGIETALAVAGLAASVGSTVIGMAGASQQAAAQRASAEYQAAVARNNAEIANANAQRAIEKGNLDAQRQSQKTAAAISAQKAAAAANGLDVNQGSPVDIRASTASLGMLDAMTIMNNAQVQNATYRNQANSFIAQSQLDMAAGENATRAGEINELSSLIGGASSFSDKWMSYTSKGVPGFA